MFNRKIYLAIVVCLIFYTPLYAEEGEASSSEDWIPSVRILGGQINAVYQAMPPFNSPYEGDHSLTWKTGYGQDITHIYGIYLGAKIVRNLQAYLDIEMAIGKGISKAAGLGGFTNGDVIKTGTVDLGNDPYTARCFLRYLLPLSVETAKAERGMDSMPGDEPVRRVEIKAGKMSAADDFDLNRYANNTRQQFMNWGFINNLSYDYAADTRGYSYGIVISLMQPTWRVALGSYMMPTFAQGNIFDTDILDARGDNLEVTIRPFAINTVIRGLAFFNQGRMGSYQEAINIGRARGTVPNVMADERPGRIKYGFGLNIEQPIAHDGETGAFMRLGWADGANENFAFTEADYHISLGIQLSGGIWGRSVDRAGAGYMANGLSEQHKAYLATGGSGFMLGDGALNYGWEQIFEVYYRVQVCPFTQISPAFQFIVNPGYNKDRGPVAVYSLRGRIYF